MLEDLVSNNIKRILKLKKKRERETMLNIKTEWGIVRAGLKRGPVKQN